MSKRTDRDTLGLLVELAEMSKRYAPALSGAADAGVDRAQGVRRRSGHGVCVGGGRRVVPAGLGHSLAGFGRWSYQTGGAGTGGHKRCGAAQVADESGVRP
jgi:hypothetical protein